MRRPPKRFLTRRACWACLLPAAPASRPVSSCPRAPPTPAETLAWKLELLARGSAHVEPLLPRIQQRCFLLVRAPPVAAAWHRCRAPPPPPSPFAPLRRREERRRKHAACQVHQPVDP